MGNSLNSKVVVTCVVVRESGGFLLETQAHQHERLLQLLERYHFTEQLTFAAVPSVCRAPLGDDVVPEV